MGHRTASLSCFTCFPECVGYRAVCEYLRKCALMSAHVCLCWGGIVLVVLWDPTWKVVSCRGASRSSGSTAVCLVCATCLCYSVVGVSCLGNLPLCPIVFSLPDYLRVTDRYLCLVCYGVQPPRRQCTDCLIMCTCGVGLLEI